MAKKSTSSVKTASKKKATIDQIIQDLTVANASPQAEQLFKTFTSKQSVNPKPLKKPDLEKLLVNTNLKFKVDRNELLKALNKINPDPELPMTKIPDEVRKSIEALKPTYKRFHGTKVSLAWFPFPTVFSPCSDRFGYMTSSAVRTASKLPFNVTNQLLLQELGELMADTGRDVAGETPIPAGYTYVGQFVDHDITLDVSSSLDVSTDATTVNNMRTPALDLDSLYGRGPALDPFMYSFPVSGPSTAIKFQLGVNKQEGPGGPAGTSSMIAQRDFDLPRVTNLLNAADSSNTAIIGDPRNDENLIVSQFHCAMLKFHNKVVDLLVLAGFSGDIFVEAKKIVTQHYQWAIVKDFLKRICGSSAVTAALATVVQPIGSTFRMPVEFSVAAYRFGHSMIRDFYWLSFNFPGASLADVFSFNRNPDLPVSSRKVVDFNAFFTTGKFVPVNNKARKIDSVLAHQLELLPGSVNMMAILATRNLRRGLALGLPSGQATATSFGFTPLTKAQLLSGLPQNEQDVLKKNNELLLTQTPLWYYILREAVITNQGDQLGPVGARIVAETFARMLKRDQHSYLNVSGGFTPFLPSATAGDFTFADLVNFAGVTEP